MNSHCATDSSCILVFLPATLSTALSASPKAPAPIDAADDDADPDALGNDSADCELDEWLGGPKIESGL